VVLPIICQLFALGTQVWGLVAVLGESERIMTMAVLTVVIVQLYVGRPRRLEVRWSGSAPPGVVEAGVAGGSPQDSQDSPAA
jgi:hypothetical protein